MFNTIPDFLLVAHDVSELFNTCHNEYKDYQDFIFDLRKASSSVYDLLVPLKTM